MQTDYKFGKIDGKQSTFYSNGNKQMVAQYKNGLKNGKTFIYDKDGKVVEKLKFKHNNQIKK
jgi:antitoxin component YwqK of YwqJK toxin-antitoxin module